jgi:hypothetical protein
MIEGRMRARAAAAAMSMAEAYSARRRPAPRLERVAFRTSRLAEFCGVKELVAQTGHDTEDWPLVILKELGDNALDGAEDVDIAPEIDIKVSTDSGQLTIADNGPGLSSDIIDGVLDYTVKISSREACILPSRGRQGNGLKCLIAMPFAVNGEHGCTVIESRGQAHRINFTMDPVRREPRIRREIGPSDVQNGTRITVCWPDNACDILTDAKGRFVQTAQAYTTFNPHLTLRGHWDNSRFVNIPATDRAWRKWQTSNPTSAHWYTVDQFGRYIAAHIARDQDQGREDRTVRDFISELDGLSRSGKQKLVLDATETSRTPLARFFEGGRPGVARLLQACQNNTKPVKPEHLGLIGPDHLLAECQALGAAANSFQYRKCLGMVWHPQTTLAHLPFAVEVAFAVCLDQTKPRQVVAGVNFSVGIGSPFERIRPWCSLTGLLGDQHVSPDDPVIVLIHYTCPDVQFLDRGKGILSIPSNVAGEIIRLIESVTKDWDKQKRAEIRSAAAVDRRLDKLCRALTKTEKPAPTEPTGILADKITAEAARAGMSIKALTVLSDGNDPYTSWKRRRDAEVFAALFNRLLNPGQKRHLRGLFYRCVMLVETVFWPTGKPLINTYGNWMKFQKAAAAARWLGLVPFNQIIDARNDEAKVYVPEPTTINTIVSPGTNVVPPALEAALPAFHLTGFQGRQTYRIIFYGEKTSLAEILEPIAIRIGADMVLVTGESSSTRLEEAIARAVADGRPVVLAYFTDSDPSGWQMSISVARKVQGLHDLQYPDLDIKLYRIALTVDQAREWDLPDKPIPPKEKRAAAWRERFGREQTEIDAAIELAPDRLRDAIFEAIRPFYDDTLDDRVAAAERDWQEQADVLRHGHPEYETCRKRIEETFSRLQLAAAALKAEQDLAAEILKNALPEPPELPEAAPSESPPAALFDSATDFVTASLRLIADKKLSGADEAEDEDDDDGNGNADGS